MIEGKDFYYLVYEGKIDQERTIHYTAIHSLTSIEGVASSMEWRAQGDEEPVSHEEVRALAFRRMCERVIDYYGSKMEYVR